MDLSKELPTAGIRHLSTRMLCFVMSQSELTINKPMSLFVMQ